MYMVTKKKGILGLNLISPQHKMEKHKPNNQSYNVSNIYSGNWR